MPVFHWTPVSITLLAEVVLALVMLGFLALGQRGALIRGTGQAGDGAGRFTLVLALLAGHLFLGFLRSGLDPDIQAYVTPLVSIFSMAALAAFVGAIYRFPTVLATGRAERILGLSALILLMALEVAVALLRYRALAAGHVEYRPAWMDFGFLVLVLWLALLLIRQWRIPAAAGGASGAARVLLFAGLPAAGLVAITLTTTYGITAAALGETAIALLDLLLLAALGIAFFNVLPGGGGFSIRIVAITLVTVLAILSTMAWLVSPVYLAAFRNDDLAMIGGRNFSFIPLDSGAYRLVDGGPAADQALGNPVAPGGRIALPFDFPFYGKTYRAVFYREDGLLGFDEMPVWRDVGHRFGARPAIYPLAVELGGNDVLPAGSGVYLDAAATYLRLTWYRLPGTARPEAIYTFSLTLFPDGGIDFAYLDLPIEAAPSLYVAHSTAWFAGITPGYLAGDGIALTRMGDSLPFAAAPMQGIVQDFRTGFVAYLNFVYAPIAWYVLAASAFILIVFPIFFRVGFARPLERLLLGVTRFRKGEAQVSVPVGRADEIGFLTMAFNDMARTQHAILDDLEARVESRAAEVGALAARNARLEERSRISGDLHDSVSQTLFSGTLLAEALPDLWRRDPEAGARQLAEITRLNRSALDEIRTLLTEFRPAAIIDATMGALLGDLVKRIRPLTDIATSLEIACDGRLPEDVHLNFYRIAQECLNNVMKHSGASQVHVFFDSTGRRAILTVEDNGAGFDPMIGRAGGMGLTIMRERAARAGLGLEIESADGRGTRITLIWEEGRDDD